MRDTAIKFQSWDFLQMNFPAVEDKAVWRKAKVASTSSPADLKTMEPPRETKVYDLARRFPVFNEDSLPIVELTDVHGLQM